MLKIQTQECLDCLHWYFDGAKDVGAHWPYSAHWTAYRQAGYVIAHLSLGLKFKSVTIESEHQYVQGTVGFYLDGHIVGSGSPDANTTAPERRNDVLKQNVIISAAGPLAAQRWNRPLSLLQYLRSETDEGIDCESMHPSATDGDRHLAAKPLRPECTAAAADILNARWRDVELVADALVRRKTLTCDEVVGLLAAGRNGEEPN